MRKSSRISGGRQADETPASSEHEDPENVPKRVTRASSKLPLSQDPALLTKQQSLQPELSAIYPSPTGDGTFIVRLALEGLDEGTVSVSGLPNIKAATAAYDALQLWAKMTMARPPAYLLPIFNLELLKHLAPQLQRIKPEQLPQYILNWASLAFPFDSILLDSHQPIIPSPTKAAALTKAFMADNKPISSPPKKVQRAAQDENKGLNKARTKPVTKISNPMKQAALYDSPQKLIAPTRSLTSSQYQNYIKTLRKNSQDDANHQALQAAPTSSTIFWQVDRDGSMYKVLSPVAARTSTLVLTLPLMCVLFNRNFAWGLSSQEDEQRNASWEVYITHDPELVVQGGGLPVAAKKKARSDENAVRGREENKDDPEYFPTPQDVQWLTEAYVGEKDTINICIKDIVEHFGLQVGDELGFKAAKMIRGKPTTELCSIKR